MCLLNNVLLLLYKTKYVTSKGRFEKFKIFIWVVLAVSCFRNHHVKLRLFDCYYIDVFCDFAILLRLGLMVIFVWLYSFGFFDEDCFDGRGMMISSTTFDDRIFVDLTLLHVKLRTFPGLVSRKTSRVPWKIIEMLEKLCLACTLALLHSTRNMLRIMYLNTS